MQSTDFVSAVRDIAPQRNGFVATYGLALLFLANMFNYADRSLLGIVIEPIRHELHLNDTQISLVSGFSFSLFYLLAGMAIASWVDRGNRRLILVFGVGLWSAATAATGAAQGFASLALCRMMIGVGEATVFPVALSLLADLYPGPRLARSVSIFQSSAGVGIMVGAVLSGVLAASLGWRTMFEIFGGAGLALVLLIALTMRPTARTIHKHDVLLESNVLWPVIASVLKVPGFTWLAIGYAVSNMIMACLPTWAPAFLLRSHGVKLAEVGALVGPPGVFGGLAGTILSGIFATRLIARSGNQAAGLIIPIVALPLAAPAFALFLFAPSLPMLVLGIAVMNFMLSSSLGPCVALAVALVPATRRGVTSTLILIAQTLIAFALGPLVVGVASDALKPVYGEDSLRYGLAMMLATPLLAATLIWIAREKICRK